MAVSAIIAIAKDLSMVILQKRESGERKLFVKVLKSRVLSHARRKAGRAIEKDLAVAGQ